MVDRETVRAELLRQLPRELEELIDACSVLPSVRPGDPDESPFTEHLYFKKEEAVLGVEALLKEREGRIQEIKESIEAERNTSTEPWWATEDDHYAGSERFDAYYRDVQEKKQEIEQNVRTLKDQIVTVRIEMELIEEFLAKAAQKKFSRTPLDRLGRKPGQKSDFSLRDWRDEKVRDFLGG